MWHYTVWLICWPVTHPPRPDNICSEHSKSLKAKETIEIQCVASFRHKGKGCKAKLENRGYGASAENHVCSVSLCGACVCALIKERRGFKHVKAILSHCFYTPIHILPRRNRVDTAVFLPRDLTEQNHYNWTRQSLKGLCKNYYE